MPGASRSIVIAAPVEDVFAVITDYEKYPEFLSEVKAVRVTDRRGGEALVHYEVQVLKSIRYTLRTSGSRGRWSRVNSCAKTAARGICSRKVRKP